MRKWIPVAVIGIAVVATVTLVARPGAPEWTTDSPEALAAIEAANDARMKLYYADARRHLERAVAADPDFVYAKLLLSNVLEKENEDIRKSYRDDVRSADLDRLTARERCLVERSLAFLDKEPEKATAILDACAEKLPDDPYILHEQAMHAWSQEDWPVAERIFRRLIELNPNWVIAYNQLGYTTMLQERFVEAREYFVSYRYIAPDQANPHDSLGELYIIQGQWEDARLSLEHALELKPDFWNSWEHLVVVLMLMDRFDEARGTVDRFEAVEGAPQRMVDRLRCTIDFVELAEQRADGRILKLADNGTCSEEPYQGYVTLAAHRAAARLGRWDRAEAFEADILAMLDKQTSRQKWTVEVEGVLMHMRGVRLALQGELDAALEQLRGADERMQYREVGIGLFKLMNRLTMVETLFAAGRDAEGHRLLGEVRFVNPVIVDEFEDDGLRMVGLARR